jgi:hypothetical protein
MQGRGFLTRFAEAFILDCALAADARRVMAVFPKRVNRFPVASHPEKPGLRAFKPPPCQEQSVTGKGTCDVRGFPPAWAKTRRGDGVIKRKTAGKRLRRCLQAIWPGCRETRHEPVPEQSRTFGATLRGHSQYYGIRGHVKLREVVFEHPERAWHYRLSRRSHTGRIHWQEYADAGRHHLPLPTPRIMHHISQGQGQQRDAPNGVSPVWFAIGDSLWLPRNRRREPCTSGSGGIATRRRTSSCYDLVNKAIPGWSAISPLPRQAARGPGRSEALGTKAPHRQVVRNSGEVASDCQPQGGQERGGEAMANSGEPLITGVSTNKPKGLPGLDHQGGGQGETFPLRRSQRRRPRRPGGAARLQWDAGGTGEARSSPGRESEP